MSKSAIVFRFEVHEFDSFDVLQLRCTTDAVTAVEEIGNSDSFVFGGNIDANVRSKRFDEWRLLGKNIAVNVRRAHEHTTKFWKVAQAPIE